MRILVCLLAAMISDAVCAEDLQNRIWLTWEERSQEICDATSYCDPTPRYMTRLLETPSTARAREIIGALDRAAMDQGQAVEHPDAPNWCQQTDAQTILGFDAEHWPMAEKLAALRGLDGVYFDFRKLKPPRGEDDRFGQRIHDAALARFQAAGLRVLSNEDEMEATDGKPHLNIYFSNTNPDTGCWFSIFASLTQTMLLTRNHTIKVKAGSWGKSGGYAADHADRSEYDAILIVIDQFIEDYQTANAPMGR